MTKNFRETVNARVKQKQKYRDRLRGTPISPYDLQIAEIALVNNLILVTHNLREFSRIEELRFEDWEVV